jgi:hypothetical protein
MDNKLQEEPSEENITATLSDWMDSYPCPDTPPRMMREAPLGAPTRLMRQTTVAAPTPLTRQDSVSSPMYFTRGESVTSPAPIKRYDTIGLPPPLMRQDPPGGLMRYDMPPPLTRQDTIDLENQMRELRDQMNIINDKLDRILLIIMK